MKPQTTRKPSWVIEDLAWKIQVKTPAHKTVLAFLAKQANDSGRSYAGYRYMLRACSIGSKTTMSRALQALKDQGILTWVQGGRHRPAESPRVHMAAGLLGAYRYFREHRQVSASAHTSERRRNAPKVGRNDRCPCGSGKKYKKCCGGATVN